VEDLGEDTAVEAIDDVATHLEQGPDDDQE